MNKTIIFDIDGTLIDKGSKVISGSTIQLLYKIQEHDITISLCSGRGWPGVQKTKLKSFLTTPIILELGTKIYDVNKDKLLYSKHIDLNTAVLVVLQILEKNPSVCVSYWGDDWRRIVFSIDGAAVKRHVDVYSPAQFITTSEVDDFIENIKRFPPTLLRFSNMTYNFDIDIMADKINLFPSSSGSTLEIVDKSSSKAAGIRRYCDITMVNKEDIYLVGNSYRDKEVKELLTKESIYIVGVDNREAELEQAVNKIIAAS